MTKNKMFLAVVMALSVALPAAAELRVGTEVNTNVRTGDDSEVRIESKSESDLGGKEGDSLRIRSGATGTVDLRVKERGNEVKSATGTKDNESESATGTKEDESDQNKSDRGEERSVSGKEFFKGHGFGGIIINQRAFHVDGDSVRTWTKDDEKKMKAHGASEDDINIALEAKSDENVSDIDIEKDEKTGHGTVVVKYEAKAKLLGFIPVTAAVIATSSDSGVVAEVVAPWYIRWFTSTGEGEQAALSLASKIKASHDASLSATSTVK